MKSAAADRWRRKLRGLPPHDPVFGGATLGPTDVHLAEAALAAPGTWSDETPLRKFESEFAAWNGSRAAYGFFGARVALSAAVQALGLRPGDEVILPGYTCIVVPNALRFAGLVPVYADIELDSYGLDASRLAHHVTPRTKAILLQHLYGLVARDYEATVEFARTHGLAVIEDCAQATGATFGGQKVGTRGDVAIYSLEKTKVLTTIMGGLATAQRADVAEGLATAQAAMPAPDATVVRQLLHSVTFYHARAHHPDSPKLPALRAACGGGWTSTTQAELDGQRPADYGRRLPAAVAEIGRSQLQRVDGFNAHRRRNARRWDDWCDAEGYKKPRVVDGSVPVFLRYPVLVDPAFKCDRSWARRLGVRLGDWFNGQLHPVKVALPGCPNAQVAVDRCVNLPTLW